METQLPYSGQTWFTCGYGNPIDGNAIKEKWDEGKRITSLAYTKEGWFVTMANNTGIGMQTYNVTAAWPQDWIDEKWDQDYSITAIGRSNEHWCVVMSQGSGYTSQSMIRNTWSEIAEWYSTKRDQGRFITDVAYDGKYWTVIMSKTDKYASQGYLWGDTYDEVHDEIKNKVWGRSYNVHQIVYGNGSYLVVYGNYAQNDDRRQSYNLDPSDDLKGYIRGKWDSSYDISYIGGGYSTGSTPYSSGSNARYLGTREGTFYYINDGYQQAILRFYWHNGEYLVDSSTLPMGYGQFPRYVLWSETADSYIFYRGTVDIYTGNPTVNEALPKMIVSKGWDKIVLEKANQGQDMVLTKEVTKEEYDKLTQNKTQYLLSIGVDVYGNQNNNNNSVNDSYDGGASYIDGPCKYCGGGGGCSTCNGYGSKYNPHSGTYEKCPTCRGTGECFNCYGSGKQRSL